MNYAIFVPTTEDFYGNYNYDFDEAILFTEEKELCYFINKLVTGFGKECNWSIEAINSTIKSLIGGFEEECLGRVLYPKPYYDKTSN